ncbi:MAG: proton-conducting transporter membrane subunit [Hyphomonadaceae bacterium]
MLTGAGGLIKELPARVAPFASALTLCVSAGWSGALLAPNLIGVFAGVETAWLAAVGLVALSAVRDNAGLNGAFRMLAAGGAASALMLLGAGLWWRAAGGGTLAMMSLAQIDAPGLAIAGVSLVLAALALKAAIAPLHLWLPAAIGRTRALAPLVLGVVGVLGALMALTRVAAAALPAPDLGAAVAAGLGVLGVASVVIGSVQAIGSTNLIRLTAYAGVAQGGCALLSVALGSPAGFAAGLVQIAALGAAALALLGGAAASGGSSLSALDGLARRAPLASVAITAGALSLMGAPLTLGFLGRWRMIEASVGADWWWAAAAAIAASLAGVFYGGRLIERVYFRRAAEAQEINRDPWRFALTPALAASIVAIGVGLAPAPLLNAATVAASMLSRGAP